MKEACELLMQSNNGSWLLIHTGEMFCFPCERDKDNRGETETQEERNKEKERVREREGKRGIEKKIVEE